ncbi:MAG: response regulator transcription factor [Deltaproteobacteria bacterium]|nr:response regulator transcription factor [Deltaproteobacteria bacterium]
MADRILLVEDDEKLGAQIVEHLEGASLVVRWLKDGDEARGADLEFISLVILDLMLPGTYGMDLLKIFRERSDVPVLILSARNETADKVRGLELGADDYVTKPFWPEELVARVTARLRRPVMSRGDSLTVGPFELDTAGRRVEVGGERVDLTPTEYDVLEALARRPDNAITRAALATAALDLGYERTLDVHVSRLRKKLGDHAKHIETVWGIGYRLASKTTE